MQQTPPWWQQAVIYQIYPRSFRDTNQDGIGDIPGIIEKLEYLKELGVDALWLSPVYVSPNDDYGYDIANYCDINPEYGTLDDMRRLIAEAKRRDIRIIMDLVINHTSDQHPWFLASRDPNSPYHDYYIWKKPRKGLFGVEIPPTRWTTFFAGPAWKRDDSSGEYYLHLFTEHQPDLNYRNSAVIEEIKKVMEFWLNMGIAGFRCDAINLLFKDPSGEGRLRILAGGREYYLSTPGTHAVLKELRRDILERYQAFTVGETMFVTVEQAKEFTEGDELDIIFSFDHVRQPFSGSPIQGLKAATMKWQRAALWNALYLENHDQLRSVSVYGDDKKRRVASAKMLGTLLLTLRGTPFIYQGEEIGMCNAPFTQLDQTKDWVSHFAYGLLRQRLVPRWLAMRIVLSLGRDNARTPMQWSTAAYADFSEVAPWIMVNPNYRQVNVEHELADPSSVLQYYKKLITLRRKTPALVGGDVSFLPEHRWIMSYRRQLGGESYVVVLNLSRFPKRSRTVVHGAAVLTTSGRDQVNGQLKLAPYEALVVRE